MYNLKDIKDVHFEITSKCQAKCPMCPRRIAGGPLNPFIKLDEVSLETFKTVSYTHLTLPTTCSG